MNGVLALVLLAALACAGYYALAWTRKRVAERLRARSTPAAPATPPPPVKEDVPQKFETFETRLKGDLNVGGTSTFPGNVLLQGNLIVEDDGVFNGAAEVFGSVTLGARARATEPLIVHGNLTLREGASVRATRVEGDVTLEKDAIVDGPLDCDTLHLADGARLALQEPAPRAESTTQ